MTKEIISKENPHPDIGKQKFRVRMAYTAYVDYDVVADSKDEAVNVIIDKGGIETIQWAEGWHKDEPVEVYASDWNTDHSSDAGTFDVTKVAECIPYEDNSTIDYTDTEWSTNEFEWQQDEDCGRPNIEKKKDDLEVPF
tara:strand:+ start:121 stop:537 length:417 start_codon:yes stop_codon:yes gene_type:complete